MEISGQIHVPVALAQGKVSTNWIGGWARLRTGLDPVFKNNPAPFGNPKYISKQ